MSFFKKIFGDSNEKEINKFQPIVVRINELEKEFESFSPEDLLNKTQELKQQIKNGKKLDDILSEAFACVRESAKRMLGQRHFDVQLMGGIVLHQGKIAEMKTGEGKTLTSTLPIYLNALEGRGVHVVTVNDYLARRDANWMGPVYHALGLSVACINHEKSYLYEPVLKADQNEVTVEMENLKEVSRKDAYMADIVYGTNNEFGFDYLRDNMAQRLEDVVQRDLHYAIIDEIDSVLIDEARTPLIVSMPDEESTQMYGQFAKLILNLNESEDYNIDEKMRAATLTEEGIAKVEKILGLENIYDYATIKYVHHLEQALKARALFKRDKDYVVKDGEIIIVDEFTGRMMPGRRYSEGLHQAIEAKEGVGVQKESRTLASITFQNYFRMYKKLAGMTGTAVTSAEEFHKVYNIGVIAVPTNKPMIRTDLSDSIYKSENGKFQAVIREIEERHKNGQPVLVGTVSIEKSEKLSAMMSRLGIAHQVLNAKHHEKEAQIIAQAGRLGAVTIATNMAGRGVDIMLGGISQSNFKTPAYVETSAGKQKSHPTGDHLQGENLKSGDEGFIKWEKERNKILELGGLLIIGTERHEARRIDNQLRGRSGRQGDPGVSKFFLSLEDDLMRIFGPDKIKNMMEFLKIPEDQPIESGMISKAIESAQEKIEGYNFDIRKHVLEYDDVMNKQRETIYAKRKNILEKNNIKDEVVYLIKDEIKKIVEFHTQGEMTESWNVKEINEIINSIFVAPKDLYDQLKEIKDRDKMIDFLSDLAEETYNNKEKEIGENNMRQIEKMVMLRTIDMLWLDHLENMDHLRDSVRLRAYGQQDPLVEYKKEGHLLFRKLLEASQTSIIGMIFKVNIAPADMMRQKQSPFERVATITDAKNKVGRNDPCPCGSGKKYKKCHGK